MADVEAAVEAAVAGLARPDLLVARVVVPRLHGEMLANLDAAPELAPRVRSHPGEGSAMQLGRVVGTVVASVRSPGLDGVKFLLVQPLDRRQDPVGSPGWPPTVSPWPAPASWR